ncbi:MAG: hypothetical protein PVF73_06425 [Bacteroidales bacterium]|jgi:hypothetical protein
MNKEIYLVSGKQDESFRIFRTRIFDIASEFTKLFQPAALKFTITEEVPPRFSVIPFMNRKMAAISVYRENEGPVESLKTIEGFYGAYKVKQALPVSYIKDWQDGERTPGACLLTLFSKKKNIDYDTFIERWHNGHTSLSLRIHPLWNYVRNVVYEQISGHRVCFDGIVEEQVRNAAELLNPFKFFGNPLIIIPRMITVYLDTKSFIDYKSMETYLVNEYHMIS